MINTELIDLPVLGTLQVAVEEPTMPTPRKRKKTPTQATLPMAVATPAAASPVYAVRAIPIEQIRANSYNPNAVAPPEMALLELSIWEDGYTMPIVCYYLADEDVYEIVDGYHRYTVMQTSTRVRERERGLLPVVVIQKDLSNRMASTIRHNRARGAHSIELMSNIVAELTRAGMSDGWILKHIGMDKDELLRLKQVTGLADLFKDGEFSEAWDMEGDPLPSADALFDDDFDEAGNEGEE